MKTNNFNEDFFLQIREQEAWTELSADSNFSWNEKLLERNKEKVNWSKISSNSAILWSSDMLDKFKSYIDWSELSGSGNSFLFSVDNLRKYKSHWNWKELSSNSSIMWNYNMIDEFADLINWEELINMQSHTFRGQGIGDQFPIRDFFEKYKSYFPISSLQKSRLWEDIIENDKKELAAKVLSEI